MADSDHRENNNSRVSKKGGWNAAVFIIVVEVAERFAFYGIASNLITYLTNDLGQSTTTAAKNINTWVGVSSIFPIVGAFIADSYLGRFQTVLWSSFVYFAGIVMVALSVSLVPTSHRREVFFTGLYVMAIGEGGHKPCVQTFAADQFDEDKFEEKEAKSSFFNWWYLAIVAGSSLAVLVVIYIQEKVSWTAGFSVLAGIVGAALLLFLLGIKKYRRTRPAGSPFTEVAQVLVAAARKWRVSRSSRVCQEDGKHEAGSQGQSQTKISNNNEKRINKKNLAHTNQLRFLDKATFIDDKDASNKTRNPWRLCTVNQVEETKQVIGLLPICLSLIMFCSTISQLNTFFIQQGSTMERSLGNFVIPSASLSSIVGLTIVVFVPLYDLVFVPMARRITKRPAGITILQRIGVGLFIATLNMGLCGLVEAQRVRVAKSHGLLDKPKAIIPMSIWWLAPQYVMVGISDVFTIVGMVELFYDQMPESMRSIGSAAYISVVGIGSFVSNAVISTVQTISENHGEKWLDNNLNRAHLDKFYWIIATLNAVGFVAFVLIARRFVYKKVQEDKRSEEDEAYPNVIV